MSESEGSDETVTTRVSQKGQTTIPKEIRDRLGIGPGDRVEWSDDGTRVTIAKQTPTSSRGGALPDDVSDEKRREVAEQMDEYVKEKRRGEWDGERTPSERER